MAGSVPQTVRGSVAHSSQSQNPVLLGNHRGGSGGGGEGKEKCDSVAARTLHLRRPARWRRRSAAGRLLIELGLPKEAGHVR
jgi:hypothetical protein